MRRRQGDAGAGDARNMAVLSGHVHGADAGDLCAVDFTLVGALARLGRAADGNEPPSVAPVWTVSSAPHHELRYKRWRRDGWSAGAIILASTELDLGVNRRAVSGTD